MVAVFDTNIIVDIFRSKGEAPNKILSYTEIYLPLTVCGELLFGAAVSAKPVEMKKQVMSFIEGNKIILPSSEVADYYAQIRKGLKEKGRPIPENDIWIAAMAEYVGIKLITRDQHFSHIQGLNVEFWE